MDSLLTPPHRAWIMHVRGGGGFDFIAAEHVAHIGLDRLAPQFPLPRP